MPRKYVRRTRKPRAPARSKPRRSYRPKIPRSFNPLPDMLMTRLQYDEVFTFGSTTAASTQIMCGNGIYDPNITGTGHQPLYRDQYSTLYNKYRVIGSSVSLQLSVPSVGQSSLFCLYPQVTDTTTGALTQLDLEKPYCKRTLLVGGSEPKRLSHRMSTYKMFGVPKNTVNVDDLYSSVYSGNPSNKWYWVLSCQSPDIQSTQGTFCILRMYYTVIFFDKIRQNQS